MQNQKPPRPGQETRPAGLAAALFKKKKEDKYVNTRAYYKSFLVDKYRK